MHLNNRNFPIIIFNIEDFIQNHTVLIDNTRNYFFDLPWDYYDMRRKQLDFLVEKMKNNFFNPFYMKQYFMGNIDASFLNSVLAQLSSYDLQTFESIKPFRRRSAMHLLLRYDLLLQKWFIERESLVYFSQDRGVIDRDDTIDYRHCKRLFAETHADIQTKEFNTLVCGIANLVRNNYVECVTLDITIHHTYVQATPASAGSNSPEGIHQDGYDYIVSALVIERNNIVGGASEIFGDDKKTMLLSTTLRTGQGILQADFGTSLWHHVTPFSVIAGKEFGYRASIGFDIGVNDVDIRF